MCAVDVDDLTEHGPVSYSDNTASCECHCSSSTCTNSETVEPRVICVRYCGKHAWAHTTMHIGNWNQGNCWVLVAERIDCKHQWCFEMTHDSIFATGWGITAHEKHVFKHLCSWLCGDTPCQNESKLFMELMKEEVDEGSVYENVHVSKWRYVSRVCVNISLVFWIKTLVFCWHKHD